MHRKVLCCNFDRRDFLSLLSLSLLHTLLHINDREAPCREAHQSKLWVTFAANVCELHSMACSFLFAFSVALQLSTCFEQDTTSCALRLASLWRLPALAHRILVYWTLSAERLIESNFLYWETSGDQSRETEPFLDLCLRFMRTLLLLKLSATSVRFVFTRIRCPLLALCKLVCVSVSLLHKLLHSARLTLTSVWYNCMFTFVTLIRCRACMHFLAARDSCVACTPSLTRYIKNIFPWNSKFAQINECMCDLLNSLDHYI